VGKVASPRSVTNRASRALGTPLVSHAVSSVVVTARDFDLEPSAETSEECATEVARTNTDSSNEALILTGLPNSWIALRRAALQGRDDVNTRGKPF